MCHLSLFLSLSLSLSFTATVSEDDSNSPSVTYWAIIVVVALLLAGVMLTLLWRVRSIYKRRKEEGEGGGEESDTFALDDIMRRLRSQGNTTFLWSKENIISSAILESRALMLAEEGNGPIQALPLVPVDTLVSPFLQAEAATSRENRDAEVGESANRYSAFGETERDDLEEGVADEEEGVADEEEGNAGGEEDLAAAGSQYAMLNRNAVDTPVSLVGCGSNSSADNEQTNQTSARNRPDLDVGDKELDERGENEGACRLTESSPLQRPSPVLRQNSATVQDDRRISETRQPPTVGDELSCDAVTE